MFIHFTKSLIGVRL